MTAEIDQFGNSLAAEGEERVLYAGLPEHETYQDRSVNGIPYHPEVIDWYKKKTAELGVEHRLGD